MRERGVSTPVTLQPSCVRARSRKGTRDWNPAAAGGVAADRGLAKAVGGAAAHRGGSDGRDVVGGGCTPLLARAPATNDHPWSIHGGFIRQVRPTSCRLLLLSLLCRASSTCRVIDVKRQRFRVPVCFDPRLGIDACGAWEIARGDFELEAQRRCYEEEKRKARARKRLHGVK